MYSICTALGKMGCINIIIIEGEVSVNSLKSAFFDGN